MEKSSKGKKENMTKTLGDKEVYYVNICAYEFNNIKQTINNISTYWAECDRWLAFLKTKPDIEEVYRFLLKCHARKDSVKKVYPNIGPLIALLICRDLIETGMLQMPNVDIWARLIFQVNKGAIARLHSWHFLTTLTPNKMLCKYFKHCTTLSYETCLKKNSLWWAIIWYNITWWQHK